MAFSRTWMDVAFKHLSAELHALVLEATFDGNAACQFASMDAAALLLLADSVAQGVVQKSVAFDSKCLMAAPALLLYFVAAFAVAFVASQHTLMAAWKNSSAALLARLFLFMTSVSIMAENVSLKLLSAETFLVGYWILRTASTSTQMAKLLALMNSTV